MTNEAGTSALLSRLFNAPDLANFLENSAEEMGLPVFCEYITALCTSSGQVPEQAILRAGIERTYGHQLFNGTRKPSRDKVIQLAFGLGLGLDGAQELLKVACKSPLYPRIKRDAAIIYCLQHACTFFESQAALQALGLTLLGEG